MLHWLTVPVLMAVLPSPGPPGVALALRVSRPPQIDGDLSDLAWQDAPPLAPFTQLTPDEGRPPSEPTEVRITYDDRALYFAFRCHDSAGLEGITRNLTRRDRDVASDAVIIDLDTRGTHTGAFHFEVSAAGVQRDALRTGDDALNFNWDALWTSAVRVDASGWTAEVSIPFSALRFPGGDRPDFRMQLRRRIARRSEIDLWVFVPREAHGELQRYGRLEGLTELKPTPGILLVPYVAGTLSHQTAPPSSGLPDGWSTSAQIGLDARFPITSGLTLDLTVLPDFAQVDADTVVLNLTTFEIRYPEKRAFFLEGADLFTLQDAFGNPNVNQPFYSRRIGTNVPYPVLPVGARLTQLPQPASIYGAAKLTGKAGLVELALLDAVTGAESVGLVLPGGVSGSWGQVPLSNYAVALARFPVATGTTLGVMGTAVFRAESPGSMTSPAYTLPSDSLPPPVIVPPVCPDGEPPGSDGRCTHNAVSGAIDVHWEGQGGVWLFNAALVAAFLDAGPVRMLFDGTLLGPGSAGIGGRLQVAKAAGNLLLDFEYESYSPHLDLNDSGYLREQNLHRFFGRTSWRVFDWGPTRENETGVELVHRVSWDGVTQALGLQFNNRTVWRNSWETFVELQGYLPYEDNRDTRDGGRTERVAFGGLYLYGGTNPNRAVSGALESYLRNTWQGIAVDATANLVIRPADRLELALSPTWEFVNGDPRWVETLGGVTPQPRTYRYGLQSASAPGLTLRGTFTFNPRLSLQLYAQLFFASVRYGPIYDVPVSGEKPTVLLSDLHPSGVSGAPYAVQDAVLNVNLVLRWEYLPGSTLYTVYTRSQQGGYAPFVPGNRPHIDFGALGKGVNNDAVQVKLSYAWQL